MTWLDDLLASEADVARQSLLRISERLAGMGSWAWHPNSDRLVWSDNLYRIHGLAPGEIVPTLEYVLSRVHPADRARVEAGIAAARTDDRPPPMSYRIRTSTGGVRQVQALVATRVTRPAGIVYVGSVRDVTDTHQAEREIRTHIAVSEALSQWRDFRSGARLLLQRVAEAMNFTRGVLWVPSQGTLIARVTWTSENGDIASELADIRLAPGYGIAGSAWVTGEPVSVATVADEYAYAFRAAALRHGLRGAIAIPAVHTGQVVAVLGFAGPEPLELTTRLTATLSGVSHEIGAFLARRPAELTPSLLSARELEVLQLAALGLSGPQIAQRLTVSPATVKTHFDHIYAKYRVPDRVSAVAKALREGVIS